MFKNEKFEIKMIEDGIFRLIFIENAEIELEDAKEMGTIIRQIANGQKFAVLVDGTNVFSVSPEAKVLIASKEYTKDRIAAAFIINSLGNRIAGNFFIKFNKPATPTQLFNDEKSALEWLKGVIKKDKSASLAVL